MKWTDKDIEIVISLTKEGKSYKEISEITNKTINITTPTTTPFYH
jgi:hypothetical protein